MSRISSRLEVALIVDPAKPYDRRIIRAVGSYVTQRQCNWSLYVEQDPIIRLPDLQAWAGDGILANFDDRRIAKAVSDINIPVVGIGGGYGYYEENPTIPYVRTDNRAIAELAAQHLIDLGIRSFAFCSEPPNRANGWARERAEAFQGYLAEAGFYCEVYTGRFTASRRWRESQAELEQWVSSLTPPVGMMACRDGRARHVMQACKTVGLRVPEDVAIIGVDNDDVICELVNPPLTSIEQGTKRIGFEAAALLDVMMAGKIPDDKHTTIPPEGLVVRQSTDVLATGDLEVSESLRFIRRHATDPITVQDVLDVAQLSRSTLEARFRGVLNRSIHAEINRVQVEFAMRLLTTTKIPIKEVVKRVGISSVQYFTAVMRRETGKTPGQIRTEMQP
ncbi:XylR family transcriptional regulator [Bythopirellula polymerisocia]|uniref:Xylose operon regulatory protein n=1 Tax=Bythopirellula polymerisocia TaxID=2528003 RepID=A0A5C6CDW7_9BACT|nr:DNA-binding transcriptional regulator [Bythopirellula polymerisocia]TWU22790.1 Xylose operon regulatory protein [Bythopirellula polymerisocia]